MVLPIKIHQNQGLCAECRLYESEGFRVVRIYESTNAGYLCAGVQLALSLAKVADSVEEGAE